MKAIFLVILLGGQPVPVEIAKSSQQECVEHLSVLRLDHAVAWCETRQAKLAAPPTANQEEPPE